MPGDRFLIYSDGVTECAGPSGEEFGAGGLMAHLVRETGAGCGVLDSLLTRLATHGGGRLEDDVSAVLLDLVPLVSEE